MVRTTSYEDPNRVELIRELKKAAKANSASIWGSVADRLSKSRSSRSQVNVHKINKYTSKGDIVIVPGKILGDGILNHQVDIAAYRYTSGAREKIEAAGGRVLDMLELIKDNPKGSNIKIIG